VLLAGEEEPKSPKPDLLIRSQSLNSSRRLDVKENNGEVAKSYAPFVSKGLVSLVGQPVKSPIRILRDTGATQSLIWRECYVF